MKPYWTSADGRHVLYHGDCLDVMSQLSPTFDAVVTDPPYGVELTARVTKSTKREASIKYQDDAEHMTKVIVPRVRKALGMAKCAILTPGTRSMFLYPEPAEVGCVFFPNGSGRSRWGFGCFNPIYYYGKDPYISNGLGSRPNAVCVNNWNSDDVDHPCPKPVPWMEWMVNRATLPDTDAMVLDPFTGSGTTGIACIRLGRRFVGIELEESYCELASRRMDNARPGTKFRLGKKQRPAGPFVRL